MPPLSKTTQHPTPVSTTTDSGSSSAQTTNHPSISNLPTTITDPAFICTLCWLPQPSPNKPKVLGTSSRIVCAPCWKAVLDLSICWVCGECIVRGDEVVSLGWCFWHRGCFGCLVCGGKLSLPRTSRGDNGMKWNSAAGPDGEQGGRKKKRMIGVELDKIPLCGVCEIETEGETQGQVLERGLEAVSRFDGGLSRDRLDMLSVEPDDVPVQPSRHKIRSPKRLRGSTEIDRELKRFTNGSGRQLWNSQVGTREDETSLLHNAADMGISEDGAVGDDNNHIDDELTYTGKDAGPAKPEVYVSVFDPLGEPAFKPSKTKPLPKWMLLLPSNVKREREQQTKTSSSAELSNSHEMDMLEGQIGSDLGDDCKPSKNHLREDPFASSEETTSRSQILPIAAPSSAVDIPGTVRKRATISIDPKATWRDIPGSIDHRAYRRSQTIESIYMTPPEYPSKHQLRQRTPHPSPARPTMNRHSTTSYFSQTSQKDALSDPVQDSCCVLAAYLESPNPSREGSPSSTDLSALTRPSPFVTNSSEYLERYQPQTSDTKVQKYVAKQPEPILDKIKRQRVGRKSFGEVAEETVEKRSNSDRSVKLGPDEEYGLDPRREDLKKELRNLFCEE